MMVINFYRGMGWSNLLKRDLSENGSPETSTEGLS